MLKPLVFWKRGTVMLAALALWNSPVRAALPELPTSAVVADSFLVVHVDGSKIDSASLDQSVQVILGPAAGSVAPKLQMFKDELKEMTEAGAESLTVVASGDPKAAEPAVTGFVKLKPGTDHAAFQQKMRDEQAKEAQAAGGKTPEMDIKDDGDFVIVRDKNSPVSEAAADPDRAKKFAAAFPELNKPLGIVFIPTDKIRDKMKDDISHDQGEPAWVAQISKSVAECQNVSLGVSLGESPVLDLSLQGADEESSKKLADAVDQAAQQLKAQADQMKQAGVQFAAMATSMSDLADGLKPKQEGAKVSIEVQGKVLGPALSNMLPMMLHTAGPGQAPGKAAPGSTGGL
jgi:hypothetical protein